MSNIFKLCPTHFFQGERKNFCGASLLLVTGLGQSRDREADTLSASARFASLPAEAGCETC